MKITAIYDNGGKTADRYTVITDQHKGDLPGRLDCLGLSDDPTDPQGFSLWGILLRTDDRFNYANNQWRTRTDLGRRIAFESLSEKLQKHIALRVFGKEN